MAGGGGQDGQGRGHERAGPGDGRHDVGGGRAVSPHVCEAVDAGSHRPPRAVDGGGVGDGQLAVAVRLPHGSGEDVVADDRQPGVADDGTVLDHDLDVIVALGELLPDHRRRLRRGGAEREGEAGRRTVREGVGRRTVLTRMAARRGNPHPGRPQIRHVIARDGRALLRRPVAHHLQFRGDAETQCQAQPVRVGVDMRVDQSGQ